VLLFAALLVTAADASASVTVTDLMRREVSIEKPPERILLGEGLQIVSLALLHPDPVGLLAGWGNDLKRYDPATYALFRERFPQLENVPTIGSGVGGAFSVEQALATDPDLVVLSRWQVSGSEALLRQFEAAGIPVIVVDFFERPLQNVLPSMRILGRALRREAQAEAFVGFYEKRLERISERLAAAAPDEPTVFLHGLPGMLPCCWSAGSEGIGEYIDFLGGRNIGAEVFASASGGQLSLEYVIAQDPSVYIATGLSDIGEGGLSIGSGVASRTAAEDLAKISQRPGFADLAATRNGRVHGLWNYFNGGPLNILAIEVMAKWLHPRVFADIEPLATLQEINDRFLAAPFEGTYWISLNEVGNGMAGQ